MKDRVRTIRKSLGFTMAEFAARIGVTPGAISNIENGNRAITEQMLKSICREYSVNENWLRTGEGEMYFFPEDEIATIVSEILENDDDEIYTAVLAFVKTYSQLSPDSKLVMKNALLETCINFQKLRNNSPIT